MDGFTPSFVFLHDTRNGTKTWHQGHSPTNDHPPSFNDIISCYGRSRTAKSRHVESMVSIFVVQETETFALFQLQTCSNIIFQHQEPWEISCPSSHPSSGHLHCLLLAIQSGHIAALTDPIHHTCGRCGWVLGMAWPPRCSPSPENS